MRYIGNKVAADFFGAFSFGNKRTQIVAEGIKRFAKLRHFILPVHVNLACIVAGSNGHGAVFHGNQRLDNGSGQAAHHEHT